MVFKGITNTFNHYSQIKILMAQINHNGHFKYLLRLLDLTFNSFFGFLKSPIHKHIKSLRISYFLQQTTNLKMYLKTYFYYYKYIKLSHSSCMKEHTLLHTRGTYSI